MYIYIYLLITLFFIYSNLSWSWWQNIPVHTQMKKKYIIKKERNQDTDYTINNKYNVIYNIINIIVYINFYYFLK